jgi:hypothetical protein
VQVVQLTSVDKLFNLLQTESKAPLYLLDCRPAADCAPSHIQGFVHVDPPPLQ